MQLYSEVTAFLSDKGISFDLETVCGLMVIRAYSDKVKDPIVIIPLGMTAGSPEEASAQNQTAESVISDISSKTGGRPLFISEDRWRSRPFIMKARLLAHLGIFEQIYARNCEIRRIDKKTAGEFLMANHSYGDASCRYRYGLYLKRHTGHNSTSAGTSAGTLVAVATFSNARKWIKEGKTVRSYEWTRYASLPQVRLCGGMGRLLKTFIEDVQPDDIMTYADLEWSEGKVYEVLGFRQEGVKPPVMFTVDTDTWSRIPGILSDRRDGHRYFQNSGSNKYRLKLTDYH